MSRQRWVWITNAGRVRRNCVSCGGGYRHAMANGTPSQTPILWALVLEVVVNRLFSAFNDAPVCPFCGCVQPDVIARRKRVRHLTVTLALFLLVLVMVSFGASDTITGLTYSAASLTLAIGSVVALLLHAVIAYANPNSSKETNLLRTKAVARQWEVEDAADPDPNRAVGDPRTAVPWAAPLLAVGVVGLLATCSPFVLKATAGWPTAPDTKPEVVCPGDTVRVWFPDRIKAVKGLWSGSPRASVSHPSSLAREHASVRSNDDQWGDTITGKYVNNTQTDLWADVTLPADPTLAGETVEVTVDMLVLYPTEVQGKFDNHTTEVSVTREYTLAPVGESARYRTSFWVAAAGSLLVIACGVGLWAAANLLRAPPDTGRRDSE